MHKNLRLDNVRSVEGGGFGEGRHPTITGKWDKSYQIINISRAWDSGPEKIRRNKKELGRNKEALEWS